MVRIATEWWLLYSLILVVALVTWRIFYSPRPSRGLSEGGKRCPEQSEGT
jgi:hypothetical protein